MKFGIPAWRGVVFHGEVWAWPTILFDHRDAFNKWPPLQEGMTCRWRQWEPGGKIDFDHDTPGTPADQALVKEWVERNS